VATPCVNNGLIPQRQGPHMKASLVKGRFLRGLDRLLDTGAHPATPRWRFGFIAPVRQLAWRH